MKCKFCKKKLIQQNFNKIPIVNNLLANKKLFKNGFYYCSGCCLGYNSNFIKDKILYNKDYLYDGGLSKQKIDLFKNIISYSKNINILEIGGGDGFLGREITLNNDNLEYINVDPASQKGFKTQTKFFNKFKSKDKYDLIICINVLAHVSNPQKILNKIKKFSHKNTQFIFSVQSSILEIKKGFLDNIYHEHKYYYSPKSFKKLLKRSGFNSNNYYEINLHGKSILFSNKEIKFLKKIKNVNKNLILKKDFKKIFFKYKSKIKILENKIKNSKNIVALGCAPRSIKLIYDLSLNNQKKILKIFEPKNSRKIGAILPLNKLKIFKESNIINDNYTYMWMPYHLDPPKKFKNIFPALT